MAITAFDDHPDEWLMDFINNPDDWDTYDGWALSGERHVMEGETHRLRHPSTGEPLFHFEQTDDNEDWQR